MDFPAVMNRLELHAKAAGLALRNQVTDVAIGPPTPKGSRSVRLFYAGEGDPTSKMGGSRVLNGELVAERIVILGFWQVTNQSETYLETVMLEMRAFKHELRTRILGDAKLNGGITDLYLTFADIDFAAIGTAGFAVLTVECSADYEEYAIAVGGAA